jgi:hypothetical protein
MCKGGGFAGDVDADDCAGDVQIRCALAEDCLQPMSNGLDTHWNPWRDLGAILGAVKLMQQHLDKAVSDLSGKAEGRLEKESARSSSP